jgi:hypothetical protein
MTSIEIWKIRKRERRGRKGDKVARGKGKREIRRR